MSRTLRPFLSLAWAASRGPARPHSRASPCRRPPWASLGDDQIDPWRSRWRWPIETAQQFPYLVASRRFDDAVVTRVVEWLHAHVAAGAPTEAH